MTRAEAIARINRRYGSAQLNRRDTHFANINATKPVWWLDIPSHKLEGSVRAINLLLYDDRVDDLHYLRVPTQYFRANLGGLVVRNDKECITLELSADRQHLFQDVRPTGHGVRFGQFKI
jgi:hypothetical protein